MVTIAQLVERWIVVPKVVGSSPTGHPKIKIRPTTYHRIGACQVVARKAVNSGHMKPTARIINVGLLVRLVLSRLTANVDIRL